MYIKRMDGNCMNHKLRNDIILIIALVLIAGVSLIIFFSCSSKNDLYLEIYFMDEQVLKVSLDKDNEYEIEGEISTLKIKVSNEDVWVIQSDCEDQICVHQGHINRAGQTITCLPNKVYLKIVGGSGVDSIL